MIADRNNVQQLRLFPREHRIPVALISEQVELGTAASRRLRRSRRLEVVPVALEELRACRGSWENELCPGGPPTAAVLQISDRGDASSAQIVGELAGLVAPLPLIVVTQTRHDSSLSMLEAGAEDVLSMQDTTGAALERAILSAIYRRAADRRGRHRATDPLTGLATRAVLAAELAEKLARAGHDRVAVLYCDLDKFKVINDTHGHATGDLLLMEAARRLQRAVRSSDLVVRIGGDEFVVVLAGSGPRFDALADEVAERIVQAFRVPFELSEQSFAVSMSVGLATHRPQEDAEELLARADRALYLAKKRGKARVARYDENLDKAAAQHATSAELLREGLRRDLLGIEVQPVVDAQASRLSGHVYRPGWGQVPDSLGRAVPVQRIAEVAQQAGAGPALFRWALARAISDDDRCSLSGGGGRRWVEIPRSVLVGSPGRCIESVRVEGSAALEQLVMLIDEDDLGDSAALRAGLLDLARNGVRVAISRFGATTASLGLMERHPFEAVWVDRQVVDGLYDCQIRRAKLSAIGHMATALGQQVMIDRPRRAQDAAAASELAPVLVVDHALDLTAVTGGLGSVARANTAHDVPGVLPRR